MPKSIHSREQQHLMSLLREARTTAGLTQAQLAKRLGHNQTYVSKYEIGEKRVDLIELRAICKALRIGLVEFVERFDRAVARKG